MDTAPGCLNREQAEKERELENIRQMIADGNATIVSHP